MQQLVNILKAEYTLYQELYQVAERKTDLIVEEEIEKLENIITKEEKLIEKLQKLEKKRKKLTGERSLTEVITDSNCSYTTKLDDLRNKLLRVTVKLQEKNDLNNTLLQNALQLTNFNLNLLTNNSKQGTYGNKGNVSDENNGSKSFVNHKA